MTTEMASSADGNGLVRDAIYQQPCGSLVEVPDCSVDCIITSPPYNISQAKPQRAKLYNLVGYGPACSDRLPEDEYRDMLVTALTACRRVLKDQGSCFLNMKPVVKDGEMVLPFGYVEAAGWATYQVIVWDRKSTHNHDLTHLYPVYEWVLHLCQQGQRPRVNPVCAAWTNIWRLNWAETRNIGHPAPFPEELVYRCISLADVPANGVVLDPFCGSGTTLAVAAEMGLHYIGYEIEQQYIQIAENRIAQARTRLEISGPLCEPGCHKNTKEARDGEDVFRGGFLLGEIK